MSDLEVAGVSLTLLAAGLVICFHRQAKLFELLN